MGKNLKIKVYTDGACSGNPGPGGWGALLLIKSGTKKETVTISGGETQTTNNRMELLAVIKAIEFIQKNFTSFDNQAIKIYSDSSYVVDTVNKKTLFRWTNNGWETSKGTPVVNQDLWNDLLFKIKQNQSDAILENLEFIKVKGHSGNKFNEHIDKVAVKESEKYKRLSNSLK